MRSYSANAKRVSRIFNDNPMRPVDAAIYWIEYVARHRGAVHLRTAGSDMYWFQYYLVDVLIAVSAVWFAVAYAMFKLFACYRKSTKSKHTDPNDKPSGIRIKTE